MTLLGISAYYHDSAAALIVDGEIIAAASEERFTRIKGDNSFPHNAVGFCLDEGKIELKDVDYIIYYEDQMLKFDRIMVMSYLTSPKGITSFLAAMPKWLTQNLWLPRVIAKELHTDKNIILCKHHLSHAASAFYPSPYEDAAILTIDGVGEWSTTTIGVGERNNIKLLKEVRYPNSLGLLYSAFTYYCGFRINFGEYKLMGLAPYGKPIYSELIKKELVHINEDGSIILNQKYFDYTYGLKTINSRFESLFGGKARKPETQITQHEMDIAASIQEVTNEIVLKLAKYAKKLTGKEYLVLAGGVALNVVSMGHIEHNAGYKGIWIQPASGDAGGALGGALYHWYNTLGNKRIINPDDSMKGSFLGTNIMPNDEEDTKILEKLGAKYKIYESDEELQSQVAKLMAADNIIGVARGRMEWGPRALGSRSILASANSPDMQSRLNLKIKFRESFRPFAPMVLAEDAEEYFEIKSESPYMLRTEYVNEDRRMAFDMNKNNMIDIINQPRSDIPAITHLDYSARVQTVDKKRNPFIYGLLQHYKRITGYSVIVNTSFNVRGEPIVNTVEDAYRCFMATDMDYLVLGNRLLAKAEQDNQAMTEEDRQRWLRRFDLD